MIPSRAVSKRRGGRENTSGACWRQADTALALPLFDKHPIRDAGEDNRARWEVTTLPAASGCRACRMIMPYAVAPSVLTIDNDPRECERGERRGGREGGGGWGGLTGGEESRGVTGAERALPLFYGLWQVGRGGAGLRWDRDQD